MNEIPINPEAVRAISEGYLSLGIVGGAMLLVLIITVVAMIIFAMQLKSVFATIADKLESVGVSLQEFTKGLILNTTKNDSDQAETLRMLNQIHDISNDIRKKVVRIDDRTYKCLGNPRKEEGTS